MGIRTTGPFCASWSCFRIVGYGGWGFGAGDAETKVNAPSNNGRRMVNRRRGDEKKKKECKRMASLEQLVIRAARHGDNRGWSHQEFLYISSLLPAPNVLSISSLQQTHTHTHTQQVCLLGIGYSDWRFRRSICQQVPGLT